MIHSDENYTGGDFKNNYYFFSIFSTESIIANVIITFGKTIKKTRGFRAPTMSSKQQMMMEMILGQDPGKMFKMTKQDKIYLKEWRCNKIYLLN